MVYERQTARVVCGIATSITVSGASQDSGCTVRSADESERFDCGDVKSGMRVAVRQSGGGKKGAMLAAETKNRRVTEGGRLGSAERATGAQTRQTTE